MHASPLPDLSLTHTHVRLRVIGPVLTVAPSRDQTPPPSPRRGQYEEVVYLATVSSPAVSITPATVPASGLHLCASPHRDVSRRQIGTRMFLPATFLSRHGTCFCTRYISRAIPIGDPWICVVDTPNYLDIHPRPQRDCCEECEHATPPLRVRVIFLGCVRAWVAG